MASARLVTSGSTQLNRPNNQPNSSPSSPPCTAPRSAALAWPMRPVICSTRVQVPADDGDPLDRESPVGEDVDRLLGCVVGGERRDCPARLPCDGLAAVRAPSAGLLGHRGPPLLDAATGCGWLGWAVIWTRRGLACSATGMVRVSTPMS